MDRVGERRGKIRDQPSHTVLQREQPHRAFLIRALRGFGERSRVDCCRDRLRRRAHPRRRLRPGRLQSEGFVPCPVCFRGEKRAGAADRPRVTGIDLPARPHLKRPREQGRQQVRLRHPALHTPIRHPQRHRQLQRDLPQRQIRIRRPHRPPLLLRLLTQQRRTFRDQSHGIGQQPRLGSLRLSRTTPRIHHTGHQRIQPGPGRITLTARASSPLTRHQPEDRTRNRRWARAGFLHPTIEQNFEDRKREQEGDRGIPRPPEATVRPRRAPPPPPRAGPRPRAARARPARSPAPSRPARGR